MACRLASSNTRRVSDLFLSNDFFFKRQSRRDVIKYALHVYVVAPCDVLMCLLIRNEKLPSNFAS